MVHSHAEDVLPFGLSSVPLVPVIHSASIMGAEVPVWNIADRFGDTDLLVRNLQHAQDMAYALGNCSIVLMRGHGFVATASTLIDVVRLSIYAPKNARVLLGALALNGGVKALSAGEIDARTYNASAPFKAADYDPAGPGLRLLDQPHKDGRLLLLVVKPV